MKPFVMGEITPQPDCRYASAALLDQECIAGRRPHCDLQKVDEHSRYGRLLRGP